MAKFKIALFFLLLTLAFSAPINSSVAQESADAACPASLESVLTVVQQVCSGTGRHQACYGNALINAELQTDAESLTFASPGDVISVTTLKSLSLSEFDAEAGVWGVAEMRLQTSIPSQQPGDVTVLLFGDVSIQNAVLTPINLDVTIAGSDYVALYQEAALGSPVQQLLVPGTTAQALERSADGLWLRLDIPFTGMGWVEASAVSVQGDLASLPTNDGQQPYYRPMQAFYFQSAANSSESCSTIPANGLLIQTPDGVGKVNLLINEVNIELGSTAFIQAIPGQQMTVNLLEGSATVQTQGVSEVLYPGTQVTIPLDQNLIPSGPPSEATSYVAEVIEGLPLGLLERQFSIVPPLSAADIAFLDATSTPSPAPNPANLGPNTNNGNANGNGNTNDA
jgi:hypothetical protein